MLAVCSIGSDEFSANRIADLMSISKDEAYKKLPGIDREQAAFLKKVFGKKKRQPMDSIW